MTGNIKRQTSNGYVLIVANAIPTKEYPLNGIFEFDQAKALTVNGQRVIYLSLDLRSMRRKRNNMFGISQFEKEGIKCYQASFPLGRVPIFISRSIAVPLLKKAVSRIIKENGKPILMHAHFTDSGYYASFIKDKFDLKLVLTEHNSAVNQSEIGVKIKKIAKKAYEKSDKVLAVSDALAKNIYNNFDIKPEIVYNVLDTQLYKDIIKKNDKSEKIEFVSVGGLLYNKGFDVLLKAFKQAFNDYDNVKLTIFGDGEKKADLIELTKTLGIDNKVIFCGQQSRETIANKFAESDCFVLTSRTETFGVVYIEAMASGLPVIATKCGGPECFVNESNGLLIDTNNIQQTTEALLHMYKNSKNYDTNYIKNFVQQNFSQEVIANQLIDIYIEVKK